MNKHDMSLPWRCTSDYCLMMVDMLLEMPSELTSHYSLHGYRYCTVNHGECKIACIGPRRVMHVIIPRRVMHRSLKGDVGYR